MAEKKSLEAKPKRKVNISDEERRRRSERMQRMRKEGKVGPQFGKLGGRPRKVRASELIAEEASKNRKKIAQVLEDAIDPEQPITVRMKGVQMITDIESKERSMEMAEDEHYAKMNKDEMIDEMAQKLKENPVLAQILMDRMNGGGDVIDGTGSAREVVNGDG